MAPANSFRIDNAELAWLEADRPFSRRFGDVYFSRDDEIGESRHVFLDGNDLAARWQSHSGAHFTIGELGFGSGLNFLLSRQLWQSTQKKPAYLHYISFEKYPLRQRDMLRIHRRWPELAQLSAQLLDAYPDHSRGCHRMLLSDSVILDLHFGDAEQQLRQLLQSGSFEVDAWFLDGFSPRLNPQLWQAGLFALLGECSAADATLTSYSVAGTVRAALRASAWNAGKAPGFGRKRQMLRATRSPGAESVKVADESTAGSTKSVTEPTKSVTGSVKVGGIPEPQPWFRYPAVPVTQRRALVIGAGLAGCSMAHSLAVRGWRVSVFEQGPDLAAGASGNRQTALRCRLFQQDSAAASFYLQSFLFSVRQFHSLARHHAIHWHPCGVIQLEEALNRRQPLSKDKLQRLYPEAILRVSDNKSLSEAARTPLRGSGLLFPLGGWLDPTALCRAYLDHPDIELHRAQAVAAMATHDDGWQLENSGGSVLARADTVVLAAAGSVTKLLPRTNIPLDLVRGQITAVASNSVSEQLAAVVCGERTVFPAHQGRHSLSASYGAGDMDTGLRDADHRENVEKAGRNFQEADFLEQTALAGRCSLRCNSRDRLPLVGMIPDQAAIVERYGELTRNAQAAFTDRDQGGLHHPGLFISAAHGSHGLATCPLSSELLAALINNESPPLTAAVMQALNPVRFLIRDLKRQRLKTPGQAGKARQQD